MEDLDTELLGQLQRWHEEDQYQRIIDAIEAIPQRELRHLYDGEGPQGCFATDRILVDGCRVGYCYREEPEERDENWDSGWRFTAGATAIWTTQAAAASITSTPCATTTRTSSLCWTPNQAPPGAGTRAECSVRSCINLTKNERL